MCKGGLYIVPIVIISILYNITKFLELQTDPQFYDDLSNNVSSVIFSGLPSANYEGP